MAAAGRPLLLLIAGLVCRRQSRRRRSGSGSSSSADGPRAVGSEGRLDSHCLRVDSNRRITLAISLSQARTRLGRHVVQNLIMDQMVHGELSLSVSITVLMI